MDSIRDFLEDFWPVFLILVVFAALIGGLIWFCCYSEQQYCNTVAQLNPDYNFQWGLWTGCMVQTPSGYWTNAHDYTIVQGNIEIDE